MISVLRLFLLLTILSLTVQAQLIKSEKYEKYRPLYNAFIDVPYQTYDTQTVKLDIYQPKKDGLHPMMMWFHGGGWRKGSKDSVTSQLTPYLEAGFVVVNVQYRKLGEALAPAAVQDTRCALAFMLKNAEKYGVDKEKIVLSGTSSGGHLALITGMLPSHSKVDVPYSRDVDFKVAVIVNNYGITDVKDILSGENRKGFGVDWLGKQENREEIAESVSPLTHARKDNPAIITIHGDADPTVPYSHAVRLKKALDEAGVVNTLYTVAGGGHGSFSDEDKYLVYNEIVSFVNKQLGGDYMKPKKKK
ncbi:MAG: alpha/beta hydrolase [Ignavibacteriales bacterium]|nr:alpha/beta hydrolase [Ignavibacteriales bacterium]